MVDYFFPPLAGSGAHRTLGFANHLANFGWAATILTVEDGEYHGSFSDASLLKRIPKTVSVHRTASMEPVRLAKRLLAKFPSSAEGSDGSNRSRWSGRQCLSWVRNLDRWLLFPDRHIGWLPFAVGRALSLSRRQSLDAIYSTSTCVTSHVVAYLLKRLLGKPWVADFQDPWLIDEAGRFPASSPKMAAERLESLILRSADRVTVTTDSIKRVFTQNCSAISPDRFIVIPMGFEPDNFARLRPLRRSKFTITHFGNFYRPRSPGPFLEALGQIVRDYPDVATNVDVLFLGSFDNEMMTLTKRSLDQHNLNGTVRLGGAVSYETGLECLVSSDTLLLVTDAGWFGRNLVPGKLFEYLAAGRPILGLAPNGATAQILRETKAGIIVEPDNVGAVRDAILALYRCWKEGRLEFPADPEVVGKFAWPQLTGRFAAVLEEALSNHARHSSVGKVARKGV